MSDYGRLAQALQDIGRISIENSSEKYRRLVSIAPLIMVHSWNLNKFYVDWKSNASSLDLNKEEALYDDGKTFRGIYASICD